MVVNRQRKISIEVAPLSEFADHVRRELKFPVESIGVQLMSDIAIGRLNWKYRRKHGPTDVLSFPLHAKKQKGNNRRTAANAEYVGDIAISPETAARNAKRDARTLSLELRLLILHGMLHLAGYDHETDNGEMIALEKTLRRHFGLHR
jgi:probable rRNA maturation factor